MSCSLPPGLSLAALTLGAIVSNIGESQAAAVATETGAARLGSRECPLDISVMWTADVESPVYSTPVILPSSVGGRKQIVLATLRRAVELLEGDGSVPNAWPVEMDHAAFLASPALHDIDGDGLQDICIAETQGSIRWLTPGEGGPYLPHHRQHVGVRRVSKERGLDRNREGEFVSKEVGVGKGSAAEVAGGTAGGEGRRGLQRVERRTFSGLSERPRRSLQGEAEDPAGTGSVDPAVDEAGGVVGSADSGVDRSEWDGYYGMQAARYESDGLLYRSFEYDASGRGYWEDMGDDFGWGLGEGESSGDANGKRGVDVVQVDGHNLAAPVFADVNGNGRKDMVVAVSYFFDQSRHADPLANMDGFSPETFVAGSLGCWDLRRLKWLWKRDLGETMGGTEGGAYLYASPTVCDLDGDGSLEVLVGTGKGELHAMDARTGLSREGFPVMFDEIRGQVAVADVDGDGQLEMLVGDSSGMVACIKQDGTKLWHRQLPGTIKSMVTLGDVDGDGSLDVVVGVTTEEGSGEVWALSAEGGVPLPYFPVQLRNRKGISAAITLVDLHHKTAGIMGGAAAAGIDTYGPAKSDGGVAPVGGWGTGLHLLAPSEDGHVYVVEGATGCVNKIDLGERILSMVLADDLEGDGTLDLLVGTMSGEVVALSANVPFHPLNAWSSSVRGPLNGFVHGGYQGVFFGGAKAAYSEVVGRQFSLSFEIVDKSPHVEAEAGGEDSKPYQIIIFAGKYEIFHHAYAVPGVYAATVALKAPTRSLLRIEMTNKQQLVFEDRVFVGYNTSFYGALKWMLAVPVVLASLPFFWFHPGGSTPLPA